ncbi:MAG: MOSC domain-containing protein [Candidatus Dormibacteria bacterium]
MTASSIPVGTVDALWRFPVKSMLGEQLREVELTEHGVIGDRVYALIDSETGKVVSAKSVRLFPNLFRCQASFVEAPRADTAAPPVQITLPDGTAVRSDASDIDAALSRALGRPVRMASTAPEDFTIDRYHPDIEDVDPRGHRDATVEQKLGSAFFIQAGMPSPVAIGAFFDLFPMSILTTSTLDTLNQLRPGSRFDSRRFRMNLIVSTEEVGFVENQWIGRALHVGDRTRLRATKVDTRCVMTTLAQLDLPKDTDVLRTLVQHNRIEIGGGLFPCAGVYAVVETPGLVRTGDTVALV